MTFNSTPEKDKFPIHQDWRTHSENPKIKIREVIPFHTVLNMNMMLKPRANRHLKRPEDVAATVASQAILLMTYLRSRKEIAGVLADHDLLATNTRSHAQIQG